MSSLDAQDRLRGGPCLSRSRLQPARRTLVPTNGSAVGDPMKTGRECGLLQQLHRMALQGYEKVFS